MIKNIRSKSIELVQGDITKQDTQAIVNAANNRLSPGGGVSGAIHRAAGPDLWKEAKNLGGCETGQAVITSGYNLKAEYVIHTVGPVYSGAPRDRELLEAAYLNSLKLAEEEGIESIAFPAISTGIFGYPVNEAASVAISAVIGFLRQNQTVKLVKFVLFDHDSFEVYKKELEDRTDD